MSSDAENRVVAQHSTVPTLRLPDVLRKNLDVVFCGINPALSAAKAGHHFSSRSNRFWRVLHLAGFTPHVILPENDRTVLQFGCGLTAAVQRPTVRASELAGHEFHRAAAVLQRKLRHYRPRYVAFLGKPAFAAIFRQRTIDWGPHLMRFGGAQVWVLPNPSGLNRAFNLEALATCYRQLRTASSQLDSGRERPEVGDLPIAHYANERSMREASVRSKRINDESGNVPQFG